MSPHENTKCFTVTTTHYITVWYGLEVRPGNTFSAGLITKLISFSTKGNPSLYLN